MNLVTVNPRHRRVIRRPSFATPVFDNLINEFVNGNITNSKKNEFIKNRPAVNVIESDDSFKIEVAVPGLAKKDIFINVEKDILSISANKEANQKEGEKFLRNEFSFANFKRTFQIPEAVDSANIMATFKNGILELTLAKKEEAKELPPRTIEIK